MLMSNNSYDATIAPDFEKGKCFYDFLSKDNHVHNYIT